MEPIVEKRSMSETDSAAKPALTEAPWKEALPDIAKVNPALADIISTFNPSDDYTLIRARYPFGTNILDEGVLFLPDENNKLVPANQHSLAEIREQFFDATPLALVLDKAVEVFVETPRLGTTPFKLFKPGVTFGVWEIMAPSKVLIRQDWHWNISSGARTLFMLPRVTETTGHEKLKQQYKIRSYVPNTLSDQHTIFTEISKKMTAENKNDWHTEILFFTKKWLEPKENSAGWLRLKNHWMQEAWQQMHYWTNKMVINFNWESYMLELSKRKVKLNLYLLDTVKHLIAIGCGVIPGFKPTDDSELVAPVYLIQDAYVKHYGLKTYCPMIMQPAHLKIANNTKNSVYYSLQFPALPGRPPEDKELPTVMKMLKELKTLMEIFLDMLCKWDDISTNNTYDFLKNIEFDYFHSDLDRQGMIRPSSAIAKEDSAFKCFPQKYSKKKFPANAHFLRGCIRITFNPTI